MVKVLIIFEIAEPAENKGTSNSTPELSSGKTRNFTRTPDLVEQMSSAQPSAQEKRTPSSIQKLAVEEKSTTPKSNTKLSVEQKSDTPTSSSKPSVKQKNNTSKHRPGFSLEQRSTTPKNISECSVVQKNNTPKSTPKQKSSPKLSVKQKSNTPKDNSKASVEQKSNIPTNSPKHSVEQKSNAPNSSNSSLGHSKEEKSSLELSVEQKSNTSKSSPKLSVEQKSNIAKHNPRHSMEQKTVTPKTIPRPAVERKSNTPQNSPNFSVEKKSNKPQSTPGSPVKQKSNTPKGSSKLPVEQMSYAPKSTPGLSLEEKNSPKLTTEDKVSFKSTSKPSVDRKSPSKSTSPTSARQKSSTARNKIKSFNCEGSADPRDAALSIPSACGTVLDSTEMDTASFEGKDEQNSCSIVDSCNTRVSETGHCSSPRSVESYSDLEETSEEHCLMSYTALPPTPEKKMGRICHTIVKEGKAMVAFPSPLKELSASHSHMINNKFRDRMDSLVTGARHHLSPNSVDQSEDSCSAENESNHSPQEKSKKAGNSQVCSSNVKVQENHQDLVRKNTIATDNDQLEVSLEGNLDKSNSADQDNTSRNTPQSIENEKPQHQTHTSLEKPSTSFDVAKNANGSGKQIPTDFKNFTVISQQYPEINKNQISGQFREDDSEKIEEEEDSDVLRIEEPSENENEESDEVICTLNLTLTEFIDICSLNIGPQKQKVKRKPTLLAKIGTKSERKRRKAKGSLTRKMPPRHSMTLHTPEKNKSKKRRRTSGSSPDSHASMEDQHHVNKAGGVSPVEGKGKSGTIMQSLSTLSPNSPKESDTHSRYQKRTQQDGYYAGRSKPAEVKEESHSSTKKRRRITPIRIGDVEQHVKASTGSWGGPSTPRKPLWGQNRGNTGVHQDM